MSIAGTDSADDGRPLPDRLRRALPAALKARDRAAVSALRSALAAIDNAGAVDVAPAAGPAATHPTVAGTAVGVGATEADRRHLAAAQLTAIVRAEITERETAAHDYEQRGHPDRAAHLRAEAAALTPHVDAPS